MIISVHSYISIYNLEPAGKEYLSQLTHDYYQMIDAIQAVLGPRK